MKSFACFALLLAIVTGCGHTSQTVCSRILERYGLQTPSRSFSYSAGRVDVYDDTHALGGGMLALRHWQMPSGDVCTMGAWQTGGIETEAQSVWSLDVGSGAQIRWFDGVQWHVEPLKEGSYRGQTAYFLSGGEIDVFCYVPQAWQLLENEGRRVHDEYRGWIEVDKNEDGFTLRLCSPGLPPGYSSDFLCLQGARTLLDWEKPGLPELWSTYCNAGDGRWCFDGYYYPAPQTYEPTGPGVYYRLPAAYLCKSFAYQAKSTPAAEDLALCTVDVMLLRRNEQGYVPTPARSTWLSGDYGIGAGFYDTRFNTELMRIVLYLYERFEVSTYPPVLARYCAFFSTFAEQYGTATEGGGILVPDYWSEEMTVTPHTSLNHQLAEMILLYHTADLLDRPDLEALAERMRQAVDDTGRSWVRADHNLHYSVLAGEFGGQDYPYLTYNDLFEAQALLKERTGKEDAVFSMLMAEKKQWMDANSVTGYNQ